MNKLYDRIDFVNNTTPALNQTNLNKLSKAVDDIDDRVIEIADDVLVVVPEILDKYADIEALATNPPYIGNNGHWWTWDTDTNQYVDSGVDAGVSVTVGTTTTLPAGSSATVTNSGTDTDPILNFGIPQGVAGQDGVSPEVTIASITGGHTVTITDEDHPTGQSFNVMDGQDGAPGVGVPSGGTTGQVLKKASGTDFDTEWANESGGGSGGHTILNSSGTSMTQRTNLQFSGMSVSDDSANDKTVVTPLTPDYVDEQFNPSTTYSKGMTCIEGNVRYRYKNSTATSGHRPPNATYWEVLSVAEELNALDTYTEGETQIGYFLGKPHYRKVIKVNLVVPQPSDNPTYVVYSYTKPTGFITKLYAVIQSLWSNDNQNYIYTTTQEGSYECQYDKSVNGIILAAKVTSAATFYAKAIVVEYTKEEWS